MADNQYNTMNQKISSTFSGRPDLCFGRGSTSGTTRAGARREVVEDNAPLVQGQSDVFIRLRRIDHTLSRNVGLRGIWEVLRRTCLPQKGFSVKWSSLERGGRAVATVRLPRDSNHGTVRSELRKWAGKRGLACDYSERLHVPRTPPFNVATEPPYLGLCTWNINSFWRKKVEVAEMCQRRKIGVLALQETLCKGAFWPPTIPGYQVFSAGSGAAPGARGVLVAVKCGLAATLVAMSDYMVLVRVSGLESQRVWYIASVYIPHNRAMRKVAKRVLKAEVLRLLNKDKESRLILMGDFNTRPSFLNRIVPAFLGMSVMPVRGSDLTFWRRGRGSAIDHMLVSENVREQITHAKVRRHESLSDHFPLQAKLRARISRDTGDRIESKIPKVSQRALAENHDKIARSVHWETWRESFDADIQQEGVRPEMLDGYAERFDGIAGQLVEELQLRCKARPRKPWLPYRIIHLIKLKRKAWKKYLRASPPLNEELKKKYKLLRKEVTLLVKEFKAEAWAKYLETGIHSFREGDARGFFRWVQNTSKYKGLKNRAILPVKDSRGVLQYTAEGIADVWRSHYQDLLGSRVECTPRPTRGLMKLPPLEGLNTPITWCEIDKVLLSSKNFKAPGLSGLTWEWLKSAQGGSEGSDEEELLPMQEVILRLVNSIFTWGKIPASWQTSAIVSVPKKGDLTCCDNYRGIALMEVMIKLIGKVLIKRVVNGLETDQRLAREQAGFRHLEECAGQVGAVMEVAGRRAALPEPQPFVAIFVDFRKAYDLVPHNALFYKLECIGVRGKTLDFIKGLYSDSAFCARIGGQTSEKTPVLRGVRQGAPESPCLFNIYINDLAMRLRKGGITIPGVDEKLGSLLFADDLVALADDVKGVQRALNNIGKWAEEWGMEVGIQKCGIMVVGDGEAAEQLRDKVQSRSWNLRGHRDPLHVVSNYTYLGVELSGRKIEDLELHLSRRLDLFGKRMIILRPMLSSKSIPIMARLRILNVVGLPTLLWGREVMGPSKSSVATLETAYSKALKELVGTQSKNQGLAIAPLMIELDVNSIQHMVILARCRVMSKFPTLHSWIRVLMNNPVRFRKYTWMKDTSVWLKKWAKVEEGEPFGVSSSKIKAYFDAKLRADESMSMKHYLASKYEDTKSYLDHAVKLPRWSVGVNWIMRGRLSGVWSLHRAQGAGLITDSRPRSSCPACLQLIDADEVAHVLVTCPKYEVERFELAVILLDPRVRELSTSQKKIILLGGSTGAFSLGNSWSGAKGETLSGQAVPGYVLVARFCQLVFGSHMGTLWGPYVPGVEHMGSPLIPTAEA